MMRLADREGKLDLVSTPNGKNWFYRRAREIIERNHRGYFQSGDSRENPFVSKEYLDERAALFSETRLKQNIMGEFVDSGGEIIKGAYVDQALANFEKPGESLPGQSPLYLSGWDLARKQTATVGITIKLLGESARVIELERFRMFDWQVVLEKIKIRQEKYPGKLMVDATGLGDVVVEQLSEYNPEPVIFTGSTKAELLTNVELMHAKNLLAYPRWEFPDGAGKIWSFEDELRQARWDDNNRYDSLMALALALWPLRRRSEPVIMPRIGSF